LEKAEEKLTAAEGAPGNVIVSNELQLVNMFAYDVHAAAAVGNLHDINAEQELKAVAKVLTFIFDGNTMVFNWTHPAKVLLKLYIDPAVPVAGKYTFCKFTQP
jgi:hypothetical protein